MLANEITPSMALEQACFSFVDRIWIIASESIAGKAATCWDERAKTAREEKWELHNRWNMREGEERATRMTRGYAVRVTRIEISDTRGTEL
jgi:hypothetical protein